METPLVSVPPNTPMRSPARPYLTVASLNMARQGSARVLKEMRRFQDLVAADVLLLQETERQPGHSRSIAADIAEAFGLYHAYAPAYLMKNGGLHGLATLSRYPLSDLEVIKIKQFDLRFRNRCRIALAATVETPLGPLRTINVHLDSRINSSERIEQLAPVLDSTISYAGSFIIGGDFNTSYVRWLRRWVPLPFCARQGRAVRNMLEDAGFATPFVSTGSTFKYLRLKLDWIFLRGFAALASGLEPIGFSDHRAIWVQIAPDASIGGVDR